MKYALFFLVLFIASNIVELANSGLEDETVSDDDAFAKFKTIYNKTYADATEEASRKNTFVQNRQYIIAQNKMFTAGTLKFNLSCNQYADYTDAEFNAQLKGVLKTRPARSPDNTFVNVVLPTLPILDYRAKGAIVGAQQQGKCGANYAFAAVATLEAQLVLQHKPLVKLSEQQIIDCSSADGNQGCGGGTPENAFNYLKNFGGAVSGAAYGYVNNATTAGACKLANGTKTLIKVNKYVELPEGEDYLKAVLQKGPVVAGIDTSNLNFRFYSNGVYTEPTCKNTIADLDHYVAVIGYNTGSRGDYWIIKNSWGPGWGYSGFGKLARNGQNHCGIATDVTYPDTIAG